MTVGWVTRPRGLPKFLGLSSRGQMPRGWSSRQRASRPASAMGSSSNTAKVSDNHRPHPASFESYPDHARLGPPLEGYSIPHQGDHDDATSSRSSEQDTQEELLGFVLYWGSAFGMMYFAYLLSVEWDDYILAEREFQADTRVIGAGHSDPFDPLDSSSGFVTGADGGHRVTIVVSAPKDGRTMQISEDAVKAANTVSKMLRDASMDSSKEDDPSAGGKGARRSK